MSNPVGAQRPKFNPNVDYAREYGLAKLERDRFSAYASALESYCDVLEAELEAARPKEAETQPKGVES